MAAGASPAEHGVNSNEWKRTQAFAWPTLYGALFKGIPNFKIGIFTQWSFYYSNIPESGTTYIGSPESDDQAMTDAIRYFMGNRPNLVVVHLLDVDKKGHAYRWGSPQYYAAIGHADSLIGNMVKAIDASGLADETAIMISADHGGDYSHEIGGGDPAMPKYSAVPFIIKGPRVKQTDLNYGTIGRETRIYDIAHTLFYIFGVNKPSPWIGKPIVEAFDMLSAEPVDLAAKMRTGSHVDLSWTNASSNQTGFRIERKAAGGTYTEIAAVGDGQTAYTDAGLSPGMTYTYRVRTTGSTGYSDYSNEVTVKAGELLKDDFSDGFKTGWIEASQGKTYGPADWRETGGRLEQWSNLCDESDRYPLFTNGRVGTYLYWKDPDASSWSNYAVDVKMRSGRQRRDRADVLLQGQHPIITDLRWTASADSGS